MKVRLAIVGVGNSASTLVQGLHFYSRGGKREGFWHPVVGGLSARDVEVVTAFDIDVRKVGLDLSAAIFSKPNVARRYLNLPETGVKVSPGIHKGDVPPNLADQKLTGADRKSVAMELKRTKATMLLNLISSGTPASSREYALAALESGCSFVNCTPSAQATDPKLSAKFRRSRLVLVGDDLMSQFGGTIFHKGLLNMMVKRGVKVSKSYQLDVGGGSETFNTIDEDIRISKRKMKTAAVANEVPYSFETVAGTTDYVDYLGNERTSYFWVDASGFLSSKIYVDVYLRSSDGANGANILLDTVRAVSASGAAGAYGAVNDICAYGFKSPPRPTHFDDAYAGFAKKYLR